VIAWSFVIKTANGAEIRQITNTPFSWNELPAITGASDCGFVVRRVDVDAVFEYFTGARFLLADSVTTLPMKARKNRKKIVPPDAPGR
jgi:hypothetical protein